MIIKLRNIKGGLMKKLLKIDLLFYANIVVTFIVNYMFVSIALILGKVIDIINNKETETLMRFIVFVLIYSIIIGFFVYINNRLRAKYIKDRVLELRLAALSSTIYSSISTYHSKTSSTYYNRLTAKIETLENSYYNNIFMIMDSISTFIFAFITLMFLNSIVSMYAIIFSLIPLLIPKFFQKKSKKIQDDILDNNANYISNVQDVTDGFDVIKSYSIDEEMFLSFKDVALSLENKKYQRSEYLGRLYGTNNLASLFVQFSIIGFSGLMVIKGNLTLGVMMSITQLSGQVLSPLFSMSALRTMAKSCDSIVTEFSDYLKDFSTNDRHNLRTTKGHSKNELTINRSIILKDVVYTYSKEKKPALQNIDYTFENGKKYVVVGSSGSGKSTLLKVIQKHLPDYSGNIIIDNVELKDIPYEVLNKKISFIQPDVFLFNDSIKNNITLFDNSNESFLNQVIIESQLNDLLIKSEEGQETIVGRNGVQLSSGERQRISIARALYADCSLFIFDEATSSLDNITALEIEKMIMKSNKTVIMVTHNLNSFILNQADDIIVLDEGKIVEKGNFKQLRENDSFFKLLIDTNSNGKLN